jgi:hypothetical protein
VLSEEKRQADEHLDRARNAAQEAETHRASAEDAARAAQEHRTRAERLDPER